MLKILRDAKNIINIHYTNIENIPKNYLNVKNIFLTLLQKTLLNIHRCSRYIDTYFKYSDQ